ncbi:hypothetical protein MRX96_017530 [Rhipicephalus microplus]
MLRTHVPVEQMHLQVLTYPSVKTDSGVFDVIVQDWVSLSPSTCHPAGVNSAGAEQVGCSEADSLSARLALGTVSLELSPLAIGSTRSVLFSAVSKQSVFSVVVPGAAAAEVSGVGVVEVDVPATAALGWCVVWSQWRCLALSLQWKYLMLQCQ